MLILGFDPGGRSGVALLDLARSTAEAGTVRSVDEAVSWFRERCTSRKPAAVGIDALLTWATGNCGWRPMDEYLRRAYPAVRNSVVSCNSAYGAMGIQGIALAMRLRSIWPHIRMNETHPKVLVYTLAGERYSFNEALVSWSQEKLGIKAAARNSDELDALLSALVSWKVLSKAWRVQDLMKRARRGELLMPVPKISYWWPLTEAQAQP